MYRLFYLLLLVLSAAAHGGHDDSDQLDANASIDTSKPNLQKRSLILVNVLCVILCFAVAFVGGVSPYFMKWNEGFLVLGTQFAGGVFLGSALVHFLSDSNETFGALTTKEYPFAFMLASAGYLLTMLADCLISHVYGMHGNGSNNGDVELQGNDSSQDKILESKHLVRDGVDNSFVKVSLVAAKSFGDTILLIAASCFQAVCAGIALGVTFRERGNWANAWKALGIICLHKIFAAIAMGIALLRMIPNCPFLWCVSYAFAFAISGPIGVAIGIIIDSTTKKIVADWIFAISMGFACGVFVYLSINLLLAKGYSPQKPVFVDTAYYRFLATLLGVGVIAIVMIWDT